MNVFAARSVSFRLDHMRFGERPNYEKQFSVAKKCLNFYAPTPHTHAHPFSVSNSGVDTIFKKSEVLRILFDVLR